MTCWRRVLGNGNHGENTNSLFISGSNVLLSSWIDDHGRAECSSSRSKTPQLFWVLYERSVSSSISSSIPPLHDSSNWRCKETGRFVHPLTAVGPNSVPPTVRGQVTAVRSARAIFHTWPLKLGISHYEIYERWTRTAAGGTVVVTGRENRLSGLVAVSFSSCYWCWHSTLALSLTITLVTSAWSNN